MKVYDRNGQFIPRQVRINKRQKQQQIIDILKLIPLALIGAIIVWLLAVLVLI